MSGAFNRAVQSYFRRVHYYIIELKIISTFRCPENHFWDHTFCTTVWHFHKTRRAPNEVKQTNKPFLLSHLTLIHPADIISVLHTCTFSILCISSRITSTYHIISYCICKFHRINRDKSSWFSCLLLHNILTLCIMFAVQINADGIPWMKKNVNIWIIHRLQNDIMWQINHSPAVFV